MSTIQPDGGFRVIREDGECEECKAAGRKGTQQLAEYWLDAKPDERWRSWRCSNLSCGWAARAD
jgi:hypothetical protein